MSENLDPLSGSDVSKDELLKLFDEEERNYFQRILDMFKGLGKPSDSLEHKKAMIELQRTGAPLAAILVMAAAITVMCTIKITASEKPPVIEAQTIEATETEELIKEEPPPPEEPPELEEITEVTDVVVDIDAPPTTSAEQSPQPNPVDAVALTPTNAPVMKNVFGSRSPGLRGAKIGRFGAQGTERLVYGFLRWLKTKQLPNGMWPGGTNGNGDTGTTSLALLCLLAHGETGQSEEFGEMVNKAIRGLMDNQIKEEKDCRSGPNDPSKPETRRDFVGYFKGRDAHNYAHLVAVYALSEAYAMTRIPEIKDSLNLALPHILDGQNADGGWYYNLYAKNPVTDSSYTSWAVQALKAAKLAGIHDKRIIEALKKSARGIKKLAQPNGAFGYTNESAAMTKRYLGLTSACALILQMLDEADTDLCKKAINFLDGVEPCFKIKSKAIESSSPQYYCYYLSQVRFNLGEKHPAWIRWNEQQKRVYSAAAITVPADKSGYKDQKGTPQYITFWPHQTAKSKYKGEAKEIDDKTRLMQQTGTRDGKRNGIPVEDLVNLDFATGPQWYNSPVAANCFTALQLMVYYRNSPLAKGALTKIEEEADLKVEDAGAGAVTLEGLDDDF